MIHKSRIWCSLLLLFGSVISASQQPSKNEMQWLINVPDSPMRIDTSVETRTILIENVSARPVKQYVLGCIQTTKRGLKRRSGGRKVEVTVIPGKANFSFKQAYDEVKRECLAKSSAVAVVEVGFSDGSVWRFR